MLHQHSLVPLRVQVLVEEPQGHVIVYRTDTNHCVAVDEFGNKVRCSNLEQMIDVLHTLYPHSIITVSVKPSAVDLMREFLRKYA